MNWQPIETAPKKGRILLGSIEDGDDLASVAEGYWQEGWSDAPDDMGCDDGFVSLDFDTFRQARSFGAVAYQHKGRQPTHWMPLPPPPGDAE